LISAESGRTFDANDVAFAEELARRAAFAVDNARLFEAERRARRQVERLQGLTAALSEAVTSQQVGEVVVDQAVAAIGANAGAVLLLDPRAQALDVLASFGFSEGAVERAHGISVEARVPVAESVRGGEPVWVEDVEDAFERWDPVGFIGDRAGEAYAAVPLVVGRRALGTIALSFEEARPFTADERGLILTLADLCAQAFERARLYEQAQAARESAEAAQEQIERIQEILELGLAHLPVDELLDALIERVTALFSTDAGAILLVDEASGELRVHASVGIEPELVGEVRVPLGLGVAGTIAASGEPLVLEDVREARPVDPFLRRRAASLMGVPLRTEEGVIGVLHLTTGSTRRFAEDEVALLEAVATRAALAIERSRLYEREHRIAETLQRSMLPQEMPELPGLEIVARYVPGSSGLSIGGDWYDAIPLANGRVGVVVGDIVGKGLRAATEMVQLRNAFRAYALEGLDPAEVVERLNVLVERQALGQYSTLVYAIFDPRSEALTFVSAGHPPPLVRHADGSVLFLEGGRSLPLGVAPDVRCEQAETTLETGATLLLFTDGLVERRDAGISDGLARLADAVRAGPSELEPLIDHLVERLVGRASDDDTGIIALRPASSPRHLTLDLPAEPSALGQLRRALRAWLARQSVEAEEIERVTLACNEACANAIEHPVDRTTELIRLEADVVDGILSMSVRDTGHWRHPSAPGDRGLGLRLIGELMDEIEVNRAPDGTEVRMSRRVSDVVSTP
jgi:serine phosphatase RsbU (regulator of sigma subunit)/anti-sigma regulatory factor (Ser/Thr protein kinase)